MSIYTRHEMRHTLVQGLLVTFGLKITVFVVITSNILEKHNTSSGDKLICILWKYDTIKKD